MKSWQLLIISEMSDINHHQRTLRTFERLTSTHQTVPLWRRRGPNTLFDVSRSQICIEPSDEPEINLPVILIISPSSPSLLASSSKAMDQTLVRCPLENTAYEHLTLMILPLAVTFKKTFWGDTLPHINIFTFIRSPIYDVHIVRINTVMLIVTVIFIVPVLVCVIRSHPYFDLTTRTRSGDERSVRWCLSLPRQAVCCSKDWI